MEPRRLREQGASNPERMLLDSARADGPPTGAAERMLSALDGLTAGSGGVGAPVAAHATIKMGILAKVGMLTLAGLGTLGAGVLVHRMTAPGSSSRATAPAEAAMHEQPVVVAAELPRGLGSSPPPVALQPNFPMHATGSAPRQREASAVDESLTAEIRLLDLARAAVDAHHPAAAQRALDSYAHRFPQGHLRPEASVLRLAVLVRRGNRAAAKSLAARLLADDSYKAYEARIQSLLRETSSPRETGE